MSASDTDVTSKVVRAFVRDGRLTSIPVVIIGQHHPDTAALRRYLVDHDFMDRAGDRYWRSSGTVAGADPGTGTGAGVVEA